MAFRTSNPEAKDKEHDPTSTSRRLGIDCYKNYSHHYKPNMNAGNDKRKWKNPTLQISPRT
jgi:hypothetical protein